MSDAAVSDDSAPVVDGGSPDPIIERYFVRGDDPYEGIWWDTRRSTLKEVDGGSSDKGEVEVPSTWTLNASDIFQQKYIRKAGVPSSVRTESDGTVSAAFARSVPADGASFGSERSLAQVIHRMSGCWAYWGIRSGLLSSDEAMALYLDSAHLLARQVWAPNSPQWFNTGLHWAYGIGGSGEGHYYVDPVTDEVVETTVAYERPQPHACFIQPVKDDLVNEGGIMDLWVKEARLFKFGSGTGTNFSAVRGKGEPLSGGGKSSGLMSWLRIGDRSAAGIQSGGTTRRAAKMVVLDVDHPEIEDFVTWKSSEERKVAAMVTGSRVNRKVVRAVRAAVEGYQSANCVDHADRYDPLKNKALRKALKEGRELLVPDQLMNRAIESCRNGLQFDPEEYGLDWQGEAYNTVSGQQSNNSVSIPDAFMEAALSDREWTLTERTTGKARKTLRAADLLNLISEAAWNCADPGMQFVDTMNDWHTCLADGRIKATNPCSEFVFLDDNACNLASVNLVKFLRKDGTLDLQSLEAAVRLVTTILEISISMASLPSKEIARGAFDYRTLGLGYANLGALLMRMGIAYDSDEGRRISAAITSFVTAVAYDQSGKMAARVGAFARWEANRAPMTRVLKNHRAVAYGRVPDTDVCPVLPDVGVVDRATPILRASQRFWDAAVSHAETSGYRNAQVTCIAPTGTIAIVMDCDTTGIEPDYALVKHKTLAGGGFLKQVNHSVRPALETLGYLPAEVDAICAHIVGHGELRSEDKARLLGRGLRSESVARIEAALENANHLRSAMMSSIVGPDELVRLGVDPEGPILEQLGFGEAEIEAASSYAVGHQTVEGCPVLREEHLAVFECANRCGKGRRFIRGDGHLLMLASVQPFLSGAASKTVNLPAGASVAEVKATYVKAWQRGVKCVALYVDGSKFSQPLSAAKSEALFGDVDARDALDPSSPEAVRVVEKIVEKVVVRYLSERRRLPAYRRGGTQKVHIGSHKMFLRTGEYPDGTLGEIFIDTNKDGTAFRGMMNAFAMAVSVGLQHGVPLERFVDLYTFTKFEPNGMVMGDSRLITCTSLLDWVFRHLAIRYLGREDLAALPPPSDFDPKTVGEGEPSVDATQTLLDRSVVLGPMVSADGLPSAGNLSALDASARYPVSAVSFSSQAESYGGGLQSVASTSIPVYSDGDYCGQCGNFSLVRTGRCQKCVNPSCRADDGGCG